MGKRNFEGANLEALFNKPTATPAVKQALQPEPTATPATTMLERGDIISSIEDEELRAALRTKRMEGRGRPRKGQRKELVSENYCRATTIVNTAKFERLKEIALLETSTIKEVMEWAFDIAIREYEINGYKNNK